MRQLWLCPWMGDGHQKDKAMIRSFICSVLHFPFSRERLEINFKIEESYVRKPTLNPNSMGFEGLSVWWTNSYIPREGWTTLLQRDRTHPDLNLCISSSVCPSVSFITFFTQLVNISLPRVLEVALSSTAKPEEAAFGNFWFIAKAYRSWG